MTQIDINANENFGTQTINLTSGESLDINILAPEGASANNCITSLNGNNFIIDVYNRDNIKQLGQIVLKNFVKKQTVDALNINIKKPATDPGAEPVTTYVYDLINETVNGVPVSSIVYDDRYNNAFLTTGKVNGTRLSESIDASTYKQDAETIGKGMTINAGDGKNIITGSKHNDTIKAGSGNDTVYVTTGNDVITLGKGENSLVIDVMDDKEFGTQTINLTSGESLDINILAPEGASANNCITSLNGNNFIIDVYNLDNTKQLGQIILKNFVKKQTVDALNINIKKPADDPTQEPVTTYVYNLINETVNEVPVSSIVYDDRYNNAFLTTGKVNGTRLSETIDVSKYKEMETDVVKGVTINAGEGHNIITGSKHSDTIKGGSGKDDYISEVNGIATKDNDVITLGAGKNTITYNNVKTGIDRVNLTKGEELGITFKNGTYVATTDGKNVAFGFNEDSSVIINNYAKNKVAEEVTVTQNTTDTKNLEDILYTVNPISSKYTGSRLNEKIDLSEAGYKTTNINMKDGMNEVIGGDSNDTIKTGKDNDTVTASAGNDKYNLGLGSDTITYTKLSGNDSISFTKANAAKSEVMETLTVKGLQDASFTVKGNDVIAKKADEYYATVKVNRDYVVDGHVKDGNNFVKISIVDALESGIYKNLNDSEDIIDLDTYKHLVDEVKADYEFQEGTLKLTIQTGLGHSEASNKAYYFSTKALYNMNSEELKDYDWSDVIEYGADVSMLLSPDEMKLAASDTGYIFGSDAGDDYALKVTDLKVCKVVGEKEIVYTEKYFDLPKRTDDKALYDEQKASVVFKDYAKGSQIANVIIDGRTDEDDLEKIDYEIYPVSSKYTGSRLNEKIDLSEQGYTSTNINMGDGMNIVIGCEGNDIIKTGKDEDIVTATNGNDNYTLGLGENEIEYTANLKGKDIVNFTAAKQGQTKEELHINGLDMDNQYLLSAKGNDIVVATQGSKIITLKNLAKNPTIADVFVNENEIFGKNTKINIDATKGGTINGTIGNDIFAISEKAVTINRTGGKDQVNLAEGPNSASVTFKVDIGQSLAKYVNCDGNDIIYGSDANYTTFKGFANNNNDKNLNLKILNGKSKYDVTTSEKQGIVIDNKKRLELSGTNNNIAFLNSEKVTAVIDGKKDDIIKGNNNENTFVYLNGGADKYFGGTAADTYKIGTWNKNTSLIISDASKNNILSFMDNNNKNDYGSDLKLIFDVYKDGKTSSHLMFAQGTAAEIAKQYASGKGPAGVVVEDSIVYSDNSTQDVKTDDTTSFTFGKVEIAGYEMSSIDTKLNNIREDVIAWLNDDRRSYESAFEVFGSGNKADINELMVVYSNAQIA